MTTPSSESVRSPASTPEVSVIVAARNEEVSLAACLESLIQQTGIEQTGIAFEVIVVDDHSTDRTREIASSFPQVRVIEAPPLPPSWSGKNNAVATGAREARGEWLLFTDADTVHLTGSLARSLAEAKERDVAMLSYSPEQIVGTFWEKAVMPVIFAELASLFPLAKVSDPNSSDAAANGQYILIRRDVYQSIGGHAAVAGDLLEDLALARKLKQSGYKIFFRYGGDAVRTRMYRGFAQLSEGWTRSLTILFPSPRRLALLSAFAWLLAWVAPVCAALLSSHRSILTRALLIFVCCIPFAWLYARVHRTNFPINVEFLSIAFGPPMLTYFLFRSAQAHRQKNVIWKGRQYAESQTKQAHPQSLAKSKRRELTTTH
jgi:cellulose synthase/poly-beta-1,6-N-acetylglucosamine synthase-like glycosyltransferase